VLSDSVAQGISLCVSPVIFMIFIVYILRTSKNTLYTGQTKNIEKRLTEHALRSTKSAKYMRRFESFTCVYTEVCATRSAALKREAEIKRLPRKQKELLIGG
jgi:putative endonuclease